jgi:hypothetical protein
MAKKLLVILLSALVLTVFSFQMACTSGSSSGGGGDDDDDGQSSFDDDDDDWTDDDADDDDADDDQTGDCDDFCEAIRDCQLGHLIGINSMGDCINYCEDNVGSAKLNCVVNADSCDDIEDCLSGGSDDDVDDDDVDDDLDDDDIDDDVDDDDMSCDGVVNEFFFECQITMSNLDGDQLDDLGLLEWCGLCEDFVSGGKSDSPFWNCIGEASYDNCDENAMDDCFDPSGAGGCTNTVSDIYACDIMWVFTGGVYFIPEADMAAVCDLSDLDWACYQACADANCPNETEDALNCLMACDQPA